MINKLEMSKICWCIDSPKQSGTKLETESLKVLCFVFMNEITSGDNLAKITVRKYIRIIKSA